MGFSISPIISDIVMQDFEKNCLSIFDFTIPLYFRYADDTLILIPNNKIEFLTSVFNSYHGRLKFTYEVEKNNYLNFLNISLIRKHNNSIITNWYRKDTDSGKFLNFFFLKHPTHQKIWVIKNLVDQAILLSDKR